MLPTTDKETKQHTQKNKNTQRAQTCADAKKFNRKRSEIRIRIFVLIRIRMSVGSVTKCCGCITLSTSLILPSIKKVKQRIVLREIHLRTTGRHLSMGSHSVICHPTEVTLWYKYGTSRPLIARIMLTNVQTSTIPQW